MDKQRILVVHNDKEVCDGVCNILSHFSFDLTYSTDGSNALNAVLDADYDLVITETRLKKVTGFEVVQRINERKQRNDTPVIFLNKQPAADELIQSREFNAKAFLIEPYLNNSLIYAVKRGLNLDHLKANRVE